MESNADSGTQESASAGRLRSPWSRLRDATEDLLRWWRHELVGLVPVRWRHWAAPRLRVEATARELRVFAPPQVAPIDCVEVGDTPGSGRPADGPVSRCELVLDSELGLATPISLPAAAEANLCSVVGFSMDRYTPFSEAEVYFDARIARRDRRNGRIDVMLYVVPRATLDRVLTQLTSMGLAAASVDIIDGTQEQPLRSGVNLLPLATGPVPLLRARLNVMLAATALVLFFTSLLIPLYQRHQAVRALEVELATLRDPVHEAERLREDVDRRSGTLRTIIERRNGTPPALDLLRELTRLTPDEAWAGQLEIKQGRLRITGEAEAGSELMQALISSELFSDPRFEAPLTHNPKSGRERFVISLAIKERNDAP